MRFACKSLYTDFDHQIKIEYLFFDNILFDEHDVDLVYAGKDLKAKIEELEKQGVIAPEPVKRKSDAKELFKKHPEYLHEFPKVEDIGNGNFGDWGREEFNQYWAAWRKRTDLKTRINSAVHNLSDPDNIYTPITSSNIFGNNDPKEIVLDVVLKKLQLPSPSTEWAQLKEFKDDKDAKGKLYALKDWMNRLGQENLNKTEVEDRLNLLLHEYETALNYHRLEYQNVYINMPIVTTLEIVENIMKIKWSGIAKSYFELSKTELEILKAETKLVGKEVAFFTEIEESFPAKGK